MWSKVSESNARSVEEDAGKRCSSVEHGVGSDSQSVAEGAGKGCPECGVRCRKAMLGVWRKVPENDARNVEEGAGKRCLGVWDGERVKARWAPRLCASCSDHFSTKLTISEVGEGGRGGEGVGEGGSAERRAEGRKMQSAGCRIDSAGIVDG